jgi:beta-lactamase class A
VTTLSTFADHDLSEDLERIRAESGATSVAVAFYDYATGREFGHNANSWYHAASTIKLPTLVGVFAAVDAGILGLDSRVHVRNRFISVANGMAFRVERGRDAGADLHDLVGKSMRVKDLARQMIITSSNLATNLLVDLLGIEFLQGTLQRYAPDGIELHRGVEDEAAFERGINNRVTAAGLVRILRVIEERALSNDSSGRMLDILHEQEFRSGIPAGLPDTARVANKTGEISTMAHDAGLVYLPDRQPYAIAILTEWDAEATTGRRETLAALSRTVYEQIAPGSG